MQAPAPARGAEEVSAVDTDQARVRSRSERRDAEFTEYLAARQAALLRTAYLVCGDRHQAEDVLQTALAKLYLSWDEVRDRGAVDAYVRRIIVNETTSAWRRPWHRRERPTDQVPETTAHHDTYDEGRSAALWEVVRSLPPKARAVVVLRYYEQLSEAETAETLGISTGTVKSQTSRAMSMLRERTPDHLHPREEER
ncbi:RNA polymerase sigma-70 factor (sigma-E family) [Nocardioides marinisabuli]|uniref:RNA polymerase sigma-70 factor (Sigma-E family) n=1 Tax=Nocardioides marinisabuli TaxID=419476 RepID=A0A7Y9JNT0_9ACTN|nr:SigE family RNA polymerase sigma factor [Nocardioides marinisabuli]NYD56182.1 RNA polymerase sigma-70 factor (sigma-E family) [Nocardioides marinisabuli]